MRGRQRSSAQTEHLRLRSADDIEPYRVDRVHRAYVDVFLRPLVQTIHVFNFEPSGPDTPGDK